MTAKDYSSVLHVAAETYAAVQNGRQARAAANLGNAQATAVRVQIDVERKGVELRSLADRPGAMQVQTAAQGGPSANLQARAKASTPPVQALNRGKSPALSPVSAP